MASPIVDIIRTGIDSNGNPTPEGVNHAAGSFGLGLSSNSQFLDGLAASISNLFSAAGAAVPSLKGVFDGISKALTDFLAKAKDALAKLIPDSKSLWIVGLVAVLVLIVVFKIAE